MDEVRLGVIGLGRGAMLTVPGFAAHPRIAVVAAFDPSPEARAGFAEAHGARAHDSLDALLADEAIDTVYIASPHGFHAEQAIAAAARGKHVLVEKPMAVALADARAMVDAARAAGTALLVGPSHGYDPPVARAADLVAGGAYGPAMFVQAMAYTDFLYRPRHPAELDRAAGGGAVLSQATHQIDMVRRIVGSPVKSVRARVFDWDARRRADGAYAALLNFENGAAASLSYSGYAHYDSDVLNDWVGEFGGAKGAEQHPRTRAAHAAGDLDRAKAVRGYGAGRAHAPPVAGHDHFGFCLVSCPGADIELTSLGVTVHGDGGPAPIAVPLPPAPRYPVADMLAAAVLDGAAPLFDGAWGLATLACVHALLRSADEAREIAVAEILDTI